MQPTITLADIQEAQQRLAGLALRTPLIRLPIDDAPAEIWLKLENLQPIGSFKLRGAGNAIALATEAQLERGIYTASAGNMAQGVAFVARQRGIPCQVVVPDHAPATKLRAIERLGAEIIKVSFDRWWEVIVSHRFEGLEGLLIHPVSDPAVIAGNGTIGLEILDDLPDVDCIVVPYGGGGLSTGIATAVRSLRPECRILAAEVETAAPLSASLAAGEPREVDYQASFVDGIGGKSVLPDMWERVRHLLDGAVTASLEEVARAVQLLAERMRVIAEGAGATPLACVLAGRAGVGTDKIVCVVSGGNIDAGKLSTILDGRTPVD